MMSTFRVMYMDEQVDRQTDVIAIPSRFPFWGEGNKSCITISVGDNIIIHSAPNKHVTNQQTAYKLYKLLSMYQLF